LGASSGLKSIPFSSSWDEYSFLSVPASPSPAARRLWISCLPFYPVGGICICRVVCPEEAGTNSCELSTLDEGLPTSGHRSRRTSGPKHVGGAHLKIRPSYTALGCLDVDAAMWSTRGNRGCTRDGRSKIELSRTVPVVW
jgi:hypothetical protein